MSRMLDALRRDDPITRRAIWIGIAVGVIGAALVLLALSGAVT